MYNLNKTYGLPNEFREVDGFFLIYKTTHFPVFTREMGISCAGYAMEETGIEMLNQLLKDSSQLVSNMFIRRTRSQRPVAFILL